MLAEAVQPADCPTPSAQKHAARGARVEVRRLAGVRKNGKNQPN